MARPPNRDFVYEGGDTEMKDARDYIPGLGTAFTVGQKDVEGLTTSLATKLTATKAATQAASTANDVAGVVTDLNALISKLKAAGIML